MKALLICVLLIVSAVAKQPVDSPKDIIDWKKLEEAFRAYADYPSQDNAIEVMQILPESDRVKLSSDEDVDNTLDAIFDESYNFGMLERQVISGDRYAVRLAFRLFSIAYTHPAEELCILLGKLIRIDPELFLEELNDSPSYVHIHMDGLLGNYGSAYVDRLEASILESKMRLDAIQGIQENSLIDIRDRCSKNLEEHIRFLNKVLDETERNPHD